MMKKLLCLTLALLCLLLSSCNLLQRINGDTEKLQPGTVTDKSIRLIVDGCDITDQCSVRPRERYVYTDCTPLGIYGYDYDVPVLIVFRTLGAEVQWETDTRVLSTYEGESLGYDPYDKTDSRFDFEGGFGWKREIVEDEILVDHTTARFLISELIPVQISANQENTVVEITRK